MIEFFTQIDVILFYIFNTELIHPVLDFVMVRITHPEFWIIPGIAGLLLFYKVEKKKALVVIGLSLVTVAISDPVSSQILKPLFGRARPCHPDLFVEGGRFLLGMKPSRSFPSSHSMNMFAQAALLCGIYPKRKIYFLSFASLIAYTRVYTGVHYPLDIASGAVFGTLVGLGVFLTYRAAYRKFVTSRERPLASESVTHSD
ncbi:MAG: phosphatase PAP2 family protein [Chitinispirillaceae bacterium]